MAYKIISAILSFVLAASCCHEEAAPSACGPSGLRITASLPGAVPVTRTEFADPSVHDFTPRWNVGDSIAVFNRTGTLSKPNHVVFVVKEVDGNGVASFEPSKSADLSLLDDSDTYYAHLGGWLGSITPGFLVRENVIQSIVQTQVYVRPGSIDNDYFVAAAKARKAADGSVNFHFVNIIGYTAVTVPEGVTIGKMTLINRNASGSNLSAYYQVTLNDDGSFKSAERTNGTSVGGYKNLAAFCPNTTDPKSKITFEPGTYYIPTCPGSTVCGVQLFSDTAGKNDMGTISVNYTTARGVINDLGKLGLGEQPKEKEIDADYKILLVGNSFTVDASEYLPQLLRESGCTKSISITRAYHGGYRIALWDSAYSSLTQCGRRDIVNGQIHWRGDDRLDHSLENIVNSAEWDCVLIGGYSGAIKLNEDSTAPMARLARKIRAAHPEHPVKIGYLMTHPSARGYSDLVDNWGNDQNAQYRALVSEARAMQDVEGVDFVISTGTAIQNLRTTCLNSDMKDPLSSDGHYIDLSRDGHHVDYGIGRYTLACVLYEALLSELTGVSLEDVPFRTDWNQTTHYYSTAVTYANAAIARKAARAALTSPFEITDLSSLSLGTVPDGIAPVSQDESPIEPVHFPVEFTLGYDTEYVVSASRQSKLRSDGIWVSPSQQQAYAQIHWAPRPSDHPHAPWTTYYNYNSAISSPLLYGLWTGDYIQFNIPVKDFAAGSSIYVRAPFFGHDQPAFWTLEYYDQGQWKQVLRDVTAYGQTCRCTFSVEPDQTVVEEIITFEDAIPEGYVRFRFVVADGSRIVTKRTYPWSIETVSHPYGTSEKYTGPVYFHARTGNNAIEIKKL